jgi:predicted transcriptional regulator
MAHRPGPDPHYEDTATVVMSSRMPPTLARKVDELARSWGVNRSVVIARLADDWFRLHDESHQQIVRIAGLDSPITA